MNDQNNSLAFIKLKSLLMNFLSDCSIQNITEIENAIKSLDSGSVEILQEFILLPFIAHLNTNPNEKIALKCIDFMALMFKNIQFKSWKFFVDNLNVLISKISNITDMNKSSCISEELKLSVCECISSMICSSSEEILNEMYSFTFRPHLAQVFFVLNNMLHKEKAKPLLKAVLQTIGVLTYNEVYLKKKKYKMTELIASEALASCLPGISITLFKVISGDDKQAHNVITMALDSLSGLIILTIGDEACERGIANDTSSEIHNIAYKSGKLTQLDERFVTSIPLVLKDETWFKSVSQNLEILMKSLTVLSSHSHWKVRYHLLKFSESLLCGCSKTLKNCTSILLSIIFGLTVDDNTLISSSAKNTLSSLSEKFQSVSCSSFNETVEDNIEKLVAEIIQCKFSANDSKKLTILKSLLGYIEISNTSLNKLIFSPVFLQRIVLTLLTLLEFDVSQINLIEELPNVQNFDAAHTLWPKKRFQFFENEDILNTICKICYYLGRIGNGRVLVDYLLEKLSSNDLHTLQCIFVIGTVMKSLSVDSDSAQKYLTLTSEILEVFLSPSFFDIPFSNEDNLDVQGQLSVESSMNHNDVNRNRLQICLLLEAIANCSECLKADFKIHLMTVLCPVMEKAGSSNYIISQCGQLCLQYIANFCQYMSVQSLIKDNADYITNIIMIKFYDYLHKPELALILKVAIINSDAEAIVLFRDLIFQILDCLDYNQDKAHFLLHVLLCVAVSIKKWFPSKKVSFNVNRTFKNGGDICKNMKKMVKNYIVLKRKDFNSEFEEEENTSNNDDDGTDDKKPETPLHIKIICELFKRCIHLQASENRYARMVSLDIVEICISVLRDYESELHPLVHEFWSPFLKRFTEDTFVPKAFNLLIQIADECGDFVRGRTFKEVMPKIVLFLQHEYPKSRSLSFRQYQWTTNHSLQVLMLSEIGKLCTKLGMNNREFNNVATVCLSYLKKEQPKVLQEAAAKSLKALALIDSDAIWFYWNVAYSKDTLLNPPHESLLAISFPHCDDSLISLNYDFEQNIL